MGPGDAAVVVEGGYGAAGGLRGAGIVATGSGEGKGERRRGKEEEGRGEVACWCRESIHPGCEEAPMAGSARPGVELEGGLVMAGFGVGAWGGCG